MPEVDVIDVGEAVEVWANMPGVATEDLEIELHDNKLSIQAITSYSTPPGSTLRKEWRQQGYRRFFQLRRRYDTEAITAKLTNGVVKITLPKEGKSLPRKIAIE